MAVLRIKNRDCRRAARLAMGDILSILSPADYLGEGQDLQVVFEGLER